jgi:hypothetical protein
MSSRAGTGRSRLEQTIRNAFGAAAVFGTLVLPLHALERSDAGQPRPDVITIRDTRGRLVSPFGNANRSGTLLFFIALDCPISNSYAREVGRICEIYRKRGIESFVVYVEQTVKPSDAHKHWREYGYPCPGLLDPKRKLVRLASATKTPEAALFDRKRHILYRGRIDDTYITYGKRREEPTSRDLRRAIDCYLSGKPVRPDRTAVVGCYIPDL